MKKVVIISWAVVIFSCSTDVKNDTQNDVQANETVVTETVTPTEEMVGEETTSLELQYLEKGVVELGGDDYSYFYVFYDREENEYQFYEANKEALQLLEDKTNYGKWYKVLLSSADVNNAKIVGMEMLETKKDDKEMLYGSWISATDPNVKKIVEIDKNSKLGENDKGTYIDIQQSSSTWRYYYKIVSDTLYVSVSPKFEGIEQRRKGDKLIRYQK